jgi:cysteine desulfurase / selenocysteine lyase
MPFLVESIRAEFPIFRDRPFHYLDNAATAQMPGQVVAALTHFETRQRANVYGGVYRHAREAVAAYEGARGDVARFLGVASPREIVFTSGATSAINLLAHSFGQRLVPGDEVLISVLEHHSNILPWQDLAQRRGISLKVLPITSDGRLDLAALPRLVTKRCRLIALTHCSNVTGAITEVAPIVAAARSVGAAVMLDGAQRVPHGPLDITELGIDFYALSGHKMFGPTGIGILWGREALLADMPPFMVGGQMIRHVSLDAAEFAEPPRRFEAGTPPIAAAIGLGAAVRWMERIDWAEAAGHEQRLTRRVINALSAKDGIRLIGPSAITGRRGVVSFAFRDMSSEKVCCHFDRSGVMLRHGHHCAQPLMAAFGVEGTARLSLAPYNNDEDIDAFEQALDELVARHIA